MCRKMIRIGKIVLLIIVVVVILLGTIGIVAEATGLVDDTVKGGNLYSEHPLNNYQLDFYVDSSWDWLPWNWGDGLGKSVMFGLYAITNFIWTVSLYLSNATGYVVQEAYQLDFISETASSIGKNIQTLAGITSKGIQPSGFYFGFLLLIILVVGSYVTYTGLIKRETTKAIRAVVNFLAIFLLSGSFIAFAPGYITKINEFSSDVSGAALKLGTKIVIPNSESQGKDSVELIRDSLFAIQVQQPWLLLQFDNSNVKEIGDQRVNEILNVSPDKDKGKDRESAVKKEIEDNDNPNLSITKTMNRLGTVVFLFLFNIGISFFIFLLTGIMIFSQILFIIFAMFLPISFLLSMIPTYEGLGRKAIMRLFNTIMMRAGITLVITTAFSISTMFYNISASYPFFMVAFLQIVTFAGIYLKLGDIMSMFSLQSSETQSMGKQIIRKPRSEANRRIKQLTRKAGRGLAIGGGVLLGSNSFDKKLKPVPMTKRAGDQSRTDDKSSSSFHDQNGSHNQKPARKSPSRSNVTGRNVGRILDIKDATKSKANLAKEQMKNVPTNLKYGLHKGTQKMKRVPKDFKRGLVQEKENRKTNRQNQQETQRKQLDNRRRIVKRAAGQTNKDNYTNKFGGRKRLDQRMKPISSNANTSDHQVKKVIPKESLGKLEKIVNKSRPISVRPNQLISNTVLSNREKISNFQQVRAQSKLAQSGKRTYKKRIIKNGYIRAGDR